MDLLFGVGQADVRPYFFCCNFCSYLAHGQQSLNSVGSLYALKPVLVAGFREALPFVIGVVN